MQISTRGRYGVKALYQLALDSREGPVPLRHIAREQGLSESYLEQLMGPLRRAGLVKSVRGARGGYLLGRSADDITVGDVLRVLEGPLFPCDCVDDSDDAVDHCGRSLDCAAREVWVRIYDRIKGVVDDMTLADLLVPSEERAGIIEE